MQNRYHTGSHTASSEIHSLAMQQDGNIDETTPKSRWLLLGAVPLISGYKNHIYRGHIPTFGGLMSHVLYYWGVLSQTLTDIFIIFIHILLSHLF